MTDQEKEKEAKAAITELVNIIDEASQALVNMGRKMTIELKITFSDGDVAVKTFKTEQEILQ